MFKTWRFLKTIYSSKFISTMYIWIFLVPISIKLFEYIDKDSYTFTIFETSITLNLELPFSLIYFYFSALSFAIANLLFKWLCPNIIKENDAYNDFLLAKKQSPHLKNYADEININLSNLEKEIKKDKMTYKNLGVEKQSQLSIAEKEILNSKDNDLSGYFWKVFKKADLSKFKYLLLTSIFYGFGFILFGIVLVQNLYFVIKYIIF